MSMSIIENAKSSIWDNSPKISRVRPQVKDIPAMLENIKITPGDLIDSSYDSNVPTYDMRSLSPRTPTVSANFQFETVKIENTSSALPSATAILMSRARGIIAYQKVS